MRSKRTRAQLQRSVSTTSTTLVPTPEPPVTPTYSPHMQPAAQQMILGSPSPLQYMQALLNQGKLISRWNEAELQVQTYDMFILIMRSGNAPQFPPPPVFPTASAYATVSCWLLSGFAKQFCIFEEV
mmetsp:Transcript_25017/g.36938  ORF Transcript_25017/g.36938 Transcript_25017/m.36938 type:complete len:127 (+) Transcript_25017:272-652(+)